MYKIRGRWLGPTLLRVATGWLGAVLLVMALAFATQHGIEYSRLWAGIWCAVTLGVLMVMRLLWRRITDAGLRTGSLAKKTLVIGRVAEIHSVSAVLKTDLRVKVTHTLAVDPDAGTAGAVRWERHLARAVAIARRMPLDQVLLALPWSDFQDIPEIVDGLRVLPVNVELAMPNSAAKFLHQPAGLNAGLTLVRVIAKPLSDWDTFAKRVENLAIASAALVIAAPVMLLVALLIKIESRGPVLFRQHRFGFNNDTFEVSSSGRWSPTGRTSPTCRRRPAATGA